MHKDWKDFLSLIEKHFGKDKNLRPLFNKKNVKVSYSCGRNIGHNIKGHTNKILQIHREKGKSKERQGHVMEKLCNCPRGKECPLGGECCSRNMIYKATVNVLGRGQFFYIGQTSTTFKARLGNHMSDFRLESRRKTRSSVSSYGG